MAKVNIDISVNQRDAQNKIDRLTKSTKQAQNGFERLTVSVQQSSSAFGSFVGNVAAIGFSKLIGSMVSLVGSSIKVTKEVETLKTQFEVLTGSTTLANKAIKDLQEFAANTPFQFNELAKAQQKLLAFGFGLEESKTLLAELGDVSAASGEPIGELAVIFGQVRAAGKLTGERLLQFRERAVPIGPALAKTFNTTEAAIGKMVTEGKINFTDFEKAFKTLNDKGEFAFEGMIKRSRTLDGRLSTLGDNFKLLQASIGERLAPTMKAIVSIMTTFIQKLQNSEGFKNFINSVASLIPRAINVMFGSLSAVIDIIALLANGWRTLVAGAFTVVDAFIKVAEAQVTMQKAIKGFFGGDTSIYDSQLKGLQRFREGVEDVLLSTVSSENQIESARQGIQDAVLNGSALITEALNAETEATSKAEDAQAAADERRAAAAKERTEKEIELLKKLSEAKAAFKLAEEEDRLLQQGDDQIFLEDKLIKLQEYFTAEQEAAIQAKLNLAENEIDKQRIITEAQTQAITNRQKIEAENLKELRAGQDGYTAFLKEQAKEREDNQRSTLSTISSLANSSSRELAAIGKAAAITQIAIDTEKAVSGAYAFGNSFGGPILGGILAGVAATAQAARAANVAGINFEQGGIVPGTSFTGDNVAANVNSGEMILNRQQQANLFNLAQSGGSSGPQNIQITVQSMLDGNMVSESVSNWVANGGQLGEVQ